MFVAEGIRTVEELLRSPLTVRGVLVSPALEQAPRGVALRAALDGRGLEVVEVDEREFASAADTESPQGVLAIADVPGRELADLAVPAGKAFRCLVLDGVQDPGNVGTIVRTAAAFGAAATVALPGTVDVWNAKVVRSAMGALFVHPVVAATWETLDAFRSAHAVALWGADAGGDPVSDITRERRVAVVLGNEGNGLGPDARARVERLVSIPATHVESLNVAVAAGILLYALGA